MTENSAKRFTLEELAERHGHTAKVVDKWDAPFDWKHRVAAHIHGWDAHNYHYQADPILLTDDEYKAAIAAAESGLEPHDKAIGKPPSPEELARRIEEQAKELEAAKAEREQAQKGEAK